MRTPPGDLTEAQVASAVNRQWAITAATINYAPAGFGSHHWVLTDHASRRWFVTADAVADNSERLAELTTALGTAHALRHRCGLRFVTAPVPGIDKLLMSTTGRYAIALYPYLQHVADTPANPQQILSMLTELHNAGDDLGLSPPVDDLSIRDRSALRAALAGQHPHNRDGPYTAAFAELVRSHQQPISAAFDSHDTVAATIADDQDSWVITHGEPKPNNTMITNAGPMLVDWDTVQLAPPARDLWMTGSADEYTRITGRDLPHDQMRFYRLRWDLKDLCTYASCLTGPHHRNADTQLAWRGSIAICQRLAATP
jgi:hypothetical protein